MAIVNVKIRNNLFQLACGDGEEVRLTELSVKVDKKVQDLAKQLPRSNDLMLLAMNSIMQEDRIKELEDTISSGLPVSESIINSLSKKTEEETEVVSDSIDAISEYIEDLVVKLESKL